MQSTLLVTSKLSQMKKVITAITAFSVLALSAPTALAQSFSDVPTNHPQYAAIESLKRINVIGGYEDGTFKPNDPVQRVEALKMILGSAGINSEDATGEIGLSDVPAGVWFTKYVLKAKTEGIVKGNPDGTFKPARQVNKAEFVKMTIEAFRQDISKHTEKTTPIAADVQPTDWFMPYMSFAKTVGIVHSDLTDKLDPGKQLTRGECAEILYKMLIVQKGGDIQKMLSITESKLVDVLVKLNNNDIASALNSSNEAVFFASEALKMDSETGIVKTAHKIALGFQRLTFAYKAGLENNPTELKKLAAEAKDLAGQAFHDDQSTQPLGIKIKTQADVLLSQIETSE